MRQAIRITPHKHVVGKHLNLHHPGLTVERGGGVIAVIAITNKAQHLLPEGLRLGRAGGQVEHAIRLVVLDGDLGRSPIHREAAGASEDRFTIHYSRAGGAGALQFEPIFRRNQATVDQ